MANTTYATIAQLKQRVGVEAADTNSDTLLQSVLNTAATMVDKFTRMPPDGVEAFSTTNAGVTRYFDDNTLGWVDIDDAVAITAVVRGGTAVPSTSYKLYPYNNVSNATDGSSSPIVRIAFGWDLTTPQTLFLGNTFYNYPYPGVGVGQMAITGTWGYCSQANRPPAIGEATLLQAEYLYRRITIKTEVMAGAMRDPFNTMDRAVQMILAPYVRLAIV